MSSRRRPWSAESFRSELARRLREEREVEAQQSVSPHLQEHAREDDAAGGRRFRVRVGQPRVEREHRHLYAEGEREEAEERRLQCRRDAVRGQQNLSDLNSRVACGKSAKLKRSSP